VPEKGFVVLSHWDYDHYSLAIKRLKGLQNLEWFVPFQSSFGPCANRLLKSIENAGKINFVTAGPVALTRVVSIMKCCGQQTNRNDSGLVVRVRTNKGNVLLAGDAGYNFIPTPAKRNLAGLTVPHHGGQGTGVPPNPNAKKAVAAISCGIPNRYGHPHSATISSHLLWTIKRTIDPKAGRGPIILP
jgi:beta-lactamase superfamily II metal-dependent hydrolase